MASKEETKKQTLIKAFDVLKDSWEEKETALKKILKSMNDIDQPLMADMWLYLLKKNDNLIKTNNYSSYCLLNDILSDLTESFADEDMAHIIFRNDELMNYFFFVNKDIDELTSSLLSVLAMDDENDKLLKILSNLNNRNESLDNDHKIGTIISDMIDYIDGDYISSTTIEMICNFCESIKDTEERAVASVACLELESD